MGYGKIDINTNYLMSSQKQHDGTWYNLSSFAINTNNEYYEYYLLETIPPVIGVDDDGLPIEITPEIIQPLIIDGLIQPDLEKIFSINQNQKMLDFQNDIYSISRPKVFVPLEDGVTEIYINGSREDQFDIKDRYELMKEDSVPNIYLKDADDNMQYLNHLDIKRCYKAITIHRQNMIEYQWAKEVEIMACTTQAELDAITWTVP